MSVAWAQKRRFLYPSLNKPIAHSFCCNIKGTDVFQGCRNARCTTSSNLCISHPRTICMNLHWCFTVQFAHSLWVAVLHRPVLFSSSIMCANSSTSTRGLLYGFMCACVYHHYMILTMCVAVFLHWRHRIKIDQAIKQRGLVGEGCLA